MSGNTRPAVRHTPLRSLPGALALCVVLVSSLTAQAQTTGSGGKPASQPGTQPGQSAPRQSPPRSSGGAPAAPAAPSQPGGSPAVPPADGVGGGKAARPTWSIVLATFADEDHEAVAEAARLQITRLYPDLKGAFVRPSGSGSVLLWGEFDGPEDPRAKPALEKIKGITNGASRPFARAMLSRLEQASETSIGPWDLRQVRRKFPKVRVMYTLQVAAWSDLGSRTLTFDEIRRSAEAYCRQLRSQGYEAYYNHDANQMTSIVTVGVFGPNAYDPKSTLYAPEVEALLKKFPKHLVNGAEVLVKSDPRNPDRTVPQACRLVEVPR